MRKRFYPEAKGTRHVHVWALRVSSSSLKKYLKACFRDTDAKVKLVLVAYLEYIAV